MNNTKFEVRSSGISGRGLFATKDIKKNEVVLRWNPVILSEDEYEKITDFERTHYVYRDDGQYLLMQEPERFVNHSCDPNTKVIDRSDVALRDIALGEEITSFYLEGEDLSKCSCGAQNCKSRDNKE